MSHVSEIHWKIIARVENLASNISVRFDSAKNPGFFSSMSIPAEKALIPTILTPNYIFHQELARELRCQGLRPQGKRLPLVFLTAEWGTITVNLKVRVFPLNFVSLTMAAKFDRGVDLNEHATILQAKRLDRSTPIRQLIDFTLAALSGSKRDDHHNKMEHPSRACIYVAKDTKLFQNIDTNEELLHVKEASRLVAILTGSATSVSASDPAMVTAILCKNRAQNMKDQRETLLIDKQGVLFSEASSRPDSAKRERFYRASDLFEYAYLMQKFLAGFSEGEVIGPEATSLVDRVNPWILRPASIFYESVSHRNIWLRLIDEFNLQNIVEAPKMDEQRRSIVNNTNYNYGPSAQQYGNNNAANVGSNVNVDNRSIYNIIDEVRSRIDEFPKEMREEVLDYVDALSEEINRAEPRPARLRTTVGNISRFATVAGLKIITALTAGVIEGLSG